MADTNQTVVELPSEEIELPPVESGSYGIPNVNRKEIAVRDSVTPFMEDTSLILEKLQASEGRSPEVIQDEDADTYLMKMRSLDAEVLNTATDLSPEDSLAVAGRVQEEQVKSLSESSQYLAIKNNILATPGSENLSPKDVENMAADTLLLYGVGQMLDEKSGYSKAYDIAGMMFVTDLAWNTSEVASAIKDEYLLEDVTGDYLDSFTDMVALSNYRRDLNEEDRLRFDKRLSEIYDEVDDNEIQKAHFFDALLGRNEFFELEDMIDKGGAAATLAQIGPAVVMRIVRATQLVKRLGAIGDKQGTMKAADMAAQSPEAAKVVGSSQIDSANAGNPIKDLFAGAPEGASTEYRHYARNIDEALERLDNVSTIDVAAHTPEEQIRIAASLRKNLPKDMELDEVQVVFKEGQPVVSYNILNETGDIVESVVQP